MLEVNDNSRSTPIVLDDYAFGESMTFSDLFSWRTKCLDAQTLWKWVVRAVRGDDRVRESLGGTRLLETED
ncbi:hypothetical protein GJ744_008777 [Endocarpon pusillum]|uniref:Uncharacterized protein n=1 Tax=Endocarpon pusillum TaxID=364733 RepID=A0A8H7AQN8_9EURO|nr:hypothetical protein GJ744_008777 [Endocarpon pusillum]